MSTRRGSLRRKEPKLSTASVRDVRSQLDILEHEELIRQRWSLRFADSTLEERFQLYHEDVSLRSSVWTCSLTMGALLMIQTGTAYSIFVSDVHTSKSWIAVGISLGVTGLAVLGWIAFVCLASSQSTRKMGLQSALVVMAATVVLIISSQPILHMSNTKHTVIAQSEDFSHEHQLTQMILFLVMSLSTMATLWNLQLLQYGAVVTLTVLALSGWLGVWTDYMPKQWDVVILFLASLGMLGIGVYRAENESRAKFLRLRHLLLENLKLAQQNTFMQCQLSSHVDAIGISALEASCTEAMGSGASYSLPGTPICQSPFSPSPIGESCMENVLKVLDDIKIQVRGDDDMTRQLEFVMQTLASEQDLFHETFRGKRTQRAAGRMSISVVDSGGTEWLDLIAQQKPQLPTLQRRRSVEFDKPIVVMKPIRRTNSGLRQTVVKQVENYLMTSQRTTTSADTTTEDSPGSIGLPYRPASREKWTAKKLLSRAATSEEMDMLAFASICRFPLTSILLTTLESHHSFIHLPVRLEAAAGFILEIESRYQVKNPYHNAIHGASVVWDLNFFIRRLQTVLTPLQVFSALIAGAVHDVNHPGLSNGYLVNTSAPLAIKYSDDAVLERMHLAEAFQACTKEGCDVFDGLSPDDKRQSRRLIITMVLATDLSGHLKHVNKLKSKRYALHTPSSTDLVPSQTCGASSVPAKSDVIVDDMVFQTMIMMADLAHSVKSFSYHFAWSKLVTEEFFRQGDLEKQFNLSVSPLCDRSMATKFDKSQIGFLDFVVLPLFTAAKDVLPMRFDGLLEQIQRNTSIWRQRAEKAEKGLSPDDVDVGGQESSKPMKAQLQGVHEGSTEDESTDDDDQGLAQELVISE
ncbi:hypothetical protein Poli38472_008860 [Pythium oligandrum]|uniref:Phosphodiesterase n=1 Tax=Pythium oligandrum TaxID=41045 RepID=A0A8K1C494_PYTOL|nr:hypothetical protein Poli38472_008860 [Pythium oligandrum]|eukprot:TMW56212.1 hypothetical protein Poli38472_008860 [Pythium oligandrum]